MSSIPTETQAPAALPPLPVTSAPPALRLGGLSPMFPPATVADPGKLRLGGLSPVFSRA